MTNRRKEEIELLVSGGGLLTGVWTDLARAVCEKGGCADDLHRLSRPEGKPVIDGMAELIVQAGVDSVTAPRIVLEGETVEFTVPVDFQPDTILDLLSKENAGDFRFGFNSQINSRNFAKASATLVPGKTYRLKRADVAPGVSVSSEELLNFIKSHDGNLLGPRGGALLWRTKRQKFPKGRASVFIDEKERSPFLGGYRRGLYVRVNLDGEARCSLGYFGGDWRDDYSVFFVCDLPVPSA